MTRDPSAGADSGLSGHPDQAINSDLLGRSEETNSLGQRRSWAETLFDVLFQIIRFAFFCVLLLLGLLFMPFGLFVLVVLIAAFVRWNRRSTAAAVQRAVREEMSRQDVALTSNKDSNGNRIYRG